MTAKPDRWIAIGLESQVQTASSNPVQVDGYALAMWRGATGPVNVWEDRCPHRGMRLSYGFVRGDTLRCIYHGWGYEVGGQCVSIPAHPDLVPPKTICAKVHPSHTRYGIVWTNLAETCSADLPDVGDEEGWSPIRSIYIKLPYKAATAGVCGLAAEGGRVEMQNDVVLVHRPGMSLMMALQAVDEARTGIHVVARGDGLMGVRERLSLATEMERLRGALEAR